MPLLDTWYISITFNGVSNGRLEVCSLNMIFDNLHQGIYQIEMQYIIYT